MAKLTIYGMLQAYSVDAKGCIGRPAMQDFTVSGQWILRGIVRLNNFGQQVQFICLADIPAFVASNPTWARKNGKAKWFVADIDHGTARTMMEGVRSIQVQR